MEAVYTASGLLFRRQDITMNENEQIRCQSDETCDCIQPELYLSGINTPSCVLLLINKSHFTIGKSLENDGVLSLGNEISRKHCVIDYEQGIYRLKEG